MLKIIDSDNYKASGIETLIFPGGEPHVKVPIFENADIVDGLFLHLKLRSMQDVFFAACVMSALYQQSLVFQTFIPYFPGARQDKSDGTAPLTVAVMGGLLDYGYSTLFDPHSNVVFDYFTGDTIMPSSLLNYERSPEVSGIIAPDAGATERALDFQSKFYPDAAVIQGSKVRNSHTGELSRYQLEALPRTGNYIIVDDICDGGGTFNLLAEAFEKDPLSKHSELEMFVSHGIFSKGLPAISPRIKKIVTTDSWCSLDLPFGDGRLTVLPLLPSYLEFFKEDIEL